MIPQQQNLLSSIVAKSQMILVYTLAAHNSPSLMFVKANTGNTVIFHSSDADDEYDNAATSIPQSGNGLQDDSPVRGRSAQYSPCIRRATASEVSSLASDLRATATEFVPSQKDVPTEHATTDHASQISILPGMYALDGYGIPWFYHMYPVPWIFPPTFQHGRSKSPKKFRHRKQRLSISSPIEHKQIKAELFPFIEAPAMPGIENVTLSQPSAGAHQEPPTPELQGLTTASSDASVAVAMLYEQPAAGPFSNQFDMIAHQAALQNRISTLRPHYTDLATIRNVPAHNALHQVHGQGHSPIPSRRQHHRYAGNGLYGGRGNVGLPLYATVPFPDPVPPLGRPTEGYGRDPKAYFGYSVGTKACGTIDVERAAEHGGGKACNTCEPDH
jgi:hypothetical protein